MATRRFPPGKLLILPLLVFNSVVAVVVLGITGAYINRLINYRTALDNFDPSGQGNLSIPSDTLEDEGFGPNEATIFLVNFSLIAGVVAVTSYIVGLHHLRLLTLPTRAAAQATAWLALSLLLIAFSFAWKELALRGRGEKLVVLEALLFALTILHFIYTLLLYSPDS